MRAVCLLRNLNGYCTFVSRRPICQRLFPLSRVFGPAKSSRPFPRTAPRVHLVDELGFPRVIYSSSDVSSSSSSSSTVMSDNDGDGAADDGQPQKPFCVEYAGSGRAGCKKCKQKIDKGALRVGKLASNPFGDGLMKMWHHPNCIFDAFLKQRAATARITDLAADVDGVEALKPEDVELLQKLIDESPGPATAKAGGKGGSTPAKGSAKKGQDAGSAASTPAKKGKKEDAAAVTPIDAIFPSAGKKDGKPAAGSAAGPSTSSVPGAKSKCDHLREFRKLCASIAAEPSYTNKTNLIRDMFAKGPKRQGFDGDICLWVKLLLPGVEKRVYNLKRRQLTKLFAQMLGSDYEKMLEDVETSGDVAQTIGSYFGKSRKMTPSSKSDLTLQEVDSALDELAKQTKEEDQSLVLKSVAARCTENDLILVLRLIVHDLRITLGPKHVLDAIHSSAYEAFQASRHLTDVVRRFASGGQGGGSSSGPSPGKGPLVKQPAATASLMTPVIPMLAEACKSVEHAFKRAPNGMYAEIKYDGERVQVHKSGSTFKYFSRSLKPVLPHKVSHLKDFIPKAFPTGDDMILDSEILLVDTTNGKPLPFGTLGKHKKAAFQDASVCIFIFDCIQFNGESLLKKPLEERKKVLETHMTEIQHRVMLSEMKLIMEASELQSMITRVIREGLEGLVLKDPKGHYEPGKRHWMKVKKDYLAEGAMADTADLVVLGAWYGTGNKGGMMSVWLMGCYDEDEGVWKTVTKVHTGVDDKTLAKLQNTFKPMVTKIAKDPSKLPRWLKAGRTMVPDFVVKDPKDSPVWEITGAEFTKNEVHTADGISIRFPRITKFRDDKDYKTATSLAELRVLYENSKMFDEGGVVSPVKRAHAVEEENGGKDDDDDVTPPKKRKLDSTPSPKGKGQRTLDFFSSPSTSASAGSTLSPFKIPKRKSETKSASLHLPLSRMEERGLCNVFTDLKFHIAADVEDRELMTRYIISFDGEILQQHEPKEEATHVVAANANEAEAYGSSTSKFVPVAWVWDCIKVKKLLPITQKYSRRG